MTSRAVEGEAAVARSSGVVAAQLEATQCHRVASLDFAKDERGEGRATFRKSQRPHSNCIDGLHVQLLHVRGPVQYSVPVVPAVTGAPLLEFGERVSPNRTLKAEIKFPVTGPLSPDAPYTQGFPSQFELFVQ